MKNFSIRVELLGRTIAADYEHLHARMRAAGFGTVIVSSDGSKAHLPPAEYVHSTTEALATTKTVRNKASAAASTQLRAGLSHRVFVVQMADWASMNLQPA